MLIRIKNFYRNDNEKTTINLNENPKEKNKDMLEDNEIILKKIYKENSIIPIQIYPKYELTEENQTFLENIQKNSRYIINLDQISKNSNKIYEKNQKKSKNFKLKVNKIPQILNSYENFCPLIGNKCNYNQKNIIQNLIKQNVIQK